MIYIITFTVSLLFLWLGTEKTLRIDTRGFRSYKMNVMCVTIGISAPSLLAAVRDTSVGSDVEYYVVPYFKKACLSSNFIFYTSSIGGSKTDLAYNLINFLVSRFTDNIGIFFFIIEFFIIIFIFGGCWRIRSIVKPWKSMLFFYLFFYNMTLSTVRQCCACALVFYGICVLMNGKQEKYDVCVSTGCIVMAFFFHKTALVAILLELFFYYSNKKKIKYKTVFYYCVLTFMLFRMFEGIAVSLTLRFVSLFSDKYTYINLTGTGISGSTCIVVLCVFQIVMLLLLKRTSNNKKYLYCADTMLFLDGIWLFAIIFLGNLSITIRMCYYIQFLWIIGFPLIDKIKCNNIMSKVLINGCSIAFSLFYWWFIYIYAGVHGTSVFILR